jgi:hypothetical protein
LSATSAIGVDDAGSKWILTGVPSMLPGDRFQFCPSH